MGMGLAYCHKILSIMKSKLEVTSKSGVGSTFSFNVKAKYKSEHEEPNSVCVIQNPKKRTKEIN